MDKNKTGKYLKYAVGEIVLVVIGILIALQINNLNTEKSNRLKEKEALTEIFLDLKSDNEQLIKLKNKEREIVRIIDSLSLEYRQRGRFTNDTIHVYLGKAMRENRPKFVTTAYDVLISSGIGLIRDKEIRYDIATYYGRDIPIIERDGNDIYQEWYDVILPIIRKQADHWVWGEILVPYSIDSIFENIEIFGILKTFRGNHLALELNSKRTLIENEKLIKKIEPLIKK